MTDYAVWVPHEYIRHKQDRDESPRAMFAGEDALKRALYSRYRTLQARRRAVEKGKERDHISLEIRTWPYHRLVNGPISSADERLKKNEMV